MVRPSFKAASPEGHAIARPFEAWREWCVRSQRNAGDVVTIGPRFGRSGELRALDLGEALELRDELLAAGNLRACVWPWTGPRS